MPFGSVLTVPFDPKEDARHLNAEASGEINELELIGNYDSLLTKQRMIRAKCMELVFTIIAVVLFTYEISMSQSVAQDLLISGFFGALTMCPIVVLSLPEYNKLSVVLLILNLLNSLMLFTNGFLIFTSWYAMKKNLIANEISEDDLRTKAAQLKFWSAIMSLLTGTLYACEVFIQMLDKIRVLFQRI